MPSALAIDREAVRVLVVAVGVREAARQMGLSPATVGAWSARGKWTAKTKAAQAIAVERRIVPRNDGAQTLQTIANSPADSLAAALAADSDATKLGFSRAAAKVARHVATLAPEDLTEKDRSQAVRHWAGVASTVHTWEDKKGGNQQVLINNGILNM